MDGPAFPEIPNEIRKMRHNWFYSKIVLTTPNCPSTMLFFNCRLQLVRIITRRGTGRPKTQTMARNPQLANRIINFIRYVKWNNFNSDSVLFIISVALSHPIALSLSLTHTNATLKTLTKRFYWTRADVKMAVFKQKLSSPAHLTKYLHQPRFFFSSFVGRPLFFSLSLFPKCTRWTPAFIHTAKISISQLKLWWFVAFICSFYVKSGLNLNTFISEIHAPDYGNYGKFIGSSIYAGQLLSEC